MLTQLFQWISNLRSRMSGRDTSARHSESLPSSAGSSGSASPTTSPSGNPNLSRVMRMLSVEEGRRNVPYKDSLGYLTVGVGHLIDPRRGGSLPDYAQVELDRNGMLEESTIDRLLEDDIINAVEQLDRNLPWAASLDEVRYTVLLDMCFQMGIGGLLGFTNTLRHVREGNYEQAATNMKASLWRRQTPNRANRRIEEMRSGVFHEYV